MNFFIIALLFLSHIVVYADDNARIRNLECWLKLSTRVQNVAREFQHMPGGYAPDPVTFENDLKVINRLLSELVEANELEEAKIELTPPEVLGDEGDKRIMDFVESLSATYGYFVAQELVDVGLRARLSVREHGKPIHLTLRLPPNQIKEFRAMIAKNKLLYNGGAEQAGADQPATKPADKAPVKDQPSTPTSKDGTR